MMPLVLVGPTAAGKTDLALRLAEAHGATIVSMDAMQVYRGMDIGTAKVSPAIRARIPHLGIDVVNPDEAFSAADFAALADAAPEPKILVGGSTFYLRAWWQGLVDTPPVDLALRARLEALDDPHAALRLVDPVLADRLHPNDRVRVVRGLEVFHLGGVPLSTLHAQDPKRRRDAVVVTVDAPDLNERIDRRVLQMMDQGYLDEVRGLLAAGYARTLKPMMSLGYRHLADHLCGDCTLDEAIERTQRDTRSFARKQRSFLRGLGLPDLDPDEAAAHAFAAPASREPTG
jgi:tRNA dimethylallyltransferase